MATKSETNTSVRPEGLKSAAKQIGEIVDDFLSAVPKLEKVDGNAGKFEVATWLEHLNKDRQDAVAAHVKHLRKTLDDVKTGLIAIADAFTGLDENNADAVSKAGTTALDSIKKMDQTDIPPLTTDKWLADYDTIADEDPKDEDTFKDGKLDLDTLNKDDLKHLGLEDTLKKNDGYGPDGKSGLDLTETFVDGKVAEKPPETGPGSGKPNTGESFDPKREPDAKAEPNIYKDHRDHRHAGKDYTWYSVNGEHQTNSRGQKIYWYNSVAWVDNGTRSWVRA
ncbi:hypothetical protein [Actinoplanes derwentensis]|uniref:Uncharacterized protein n=1 Tax=Actinoplanes derwentensis TaxID=113562 RepID=A0A1H2C814_9ACTN|nr:hypothetical protein [Actinoplanes derwentensis]GID86546.1 hypothetical protein Ade03nite_54700 [Actinoplanes derwentensis]SDT66484.1 hypothetical protein SAMN04489716_5355 [Actinoplanes derwentensis]